ncbi:MAG: glycosyltransferase [Acidobacteriota bacterium]
MFELEFTGERVVPGKLDGELLLEHVSRYGFAARLVRDLEVLDFGCGTGFGSSMLRQGGARRVVGSDVSAASILFARSRYECPGVSFCVTDCEMAGLAPDSFDAVVSFELIERLASYRRFLRETKRLLRPGGLFVVSTPNTRLNRREPGVEPNPFHTHGFTPDELRQVLGEDFAQVELFSQSPTEGAYRRCAAPTISSQRWSARSVGPPTSFRLAGNGAADESPYLLALCSDEQGDVASIVGEDSFHVSETDAVRRCDGRIVELQAELEERTRWAQQVEEESARRGHQMVQLQAELDERTDWVHELASESEARARRILELQGELEERLCWATRVDKERRERGQRIRQLQGALEILGQSIQRLSEVEERFERRLVGVDERLDHLSSQEIVKSECDRQRDDAVSWNRDSLIFQQQEIERLAGRQAEREHRQRSGRRSLEQIQRAVDGLERQVAVVSQQTERHFDDHVYWAEQSRAIEFAANRSRELIDLLWGSRSWKVYAGITRWLTSLRPNWFSANRRQVEVPAAKPLRVEQVALEPRSQRRVLIIDHRLPTPDQDAGSLRMMELITVFQHLGFEVTFLPENLFAAQPYCRRLEHRDVAVVATPHVSSVRSYLLENGRRFDLVLVSRFHIAKGCIDMICELCPEARLVFDTVDLQFLRLERRAAIEANEALVADAERVRAEEFAIAARADATLVVSEVEGEMLARELPGHDVHLVSLIHGVREQVPGFDRRQGFYFVGGFEHPPNVDAALWLIREVLPKIRLALPSAVCYLVGSKAPDSIHRLASDQVVVRGHVRDLEPYLSGCRLSVAPLRWGAGVKGKVTQSLAEGVPCVMTSVAAEGVGLKHRVDGMIADDPVDFANAVVEVYRDRRLWEGLSQAGQERVRTRFSRTVATEAVEGLLDQLEIGCQS